MEMLGLKETAVQMAKANGVRWYGMCWGEMMGMFWEKRWSLKWGARGSQATKEDIEDASGEGEQERWFGEKGHHKSSEMELYLIINVNFQLKILATLIIIIIAVHFNRVIIW